MKYTVITMIYNNYDLLRTPLVVDENAEYICITDNKDLKSDVWKIIYEPKYDTNELTGVQKTYMTKYSIFDYVSNDSEYVIQLDSSLLIKKSFTPVLEYFNDNNYEMGLSIHDRKDVLDEYDVWKKLRNLKQEYVEKFLQYVKNHPYKDFNINNLKNCGLIECTIKIYKNTPIVKEFIDDIYNGILEQSNFMDANDQCMLTYILYKYIEKINILFFTAHFYFSGIYIEKYAHRSNYKYNFKYPDVSEDKILFNKYNVKTKIFK